MHDRESSGGNPRRQLWQGWCTAETWRSWGFLAGPPHRFWGLYIPAKEPLALPFINPPYSSVHPWGVPRAPGQGDARFGDLSLRV